MLLIPAIDLKDGHCVRLKQGDMDQSTIFSEDPAAMAREIVRICSLADDDWRRLSASAYATVTGYSWADATKRFEDALKLAIERSPQKAAAVGV